MKAIGVDIIEIERIADSIERYGDRFLNRVFTRQEQAYCQGRTQSLAGRWAAKEAMGKAFGTGIGDMAFKEIEVVRDERGKPDIILHGQAQLIAKKMNFKHIALSISHTKVYAVAFIVVD